jgi:hypothetical protein
LTQLLLVCLKMLPFISDAFFHRRSFLVIFVLYPTRNFVFCTNRKLIYSQTSFSGTRWACANLFERSVVRTYRGIIAINTQLIFLVARRFSQVLKRQTSLNHLCQAARTVINSAEITSQMLDDWFNVDLNSIIKQTLYTTESSNSIDNIVIVKRKTFLLWQRIHYVFEVV